MADLLSDRKHRAQKAAWFLQVVPFIRFIGLTGSLAHDLIKKNSDIDFFIITKDKRIWTCRFFVVIILKSLGIYRTGELPRQKDGKICPNCYVTDKYLIVNPQNRYVAEDYSQLIPLFDNGKIFNKFIKKNAWMQKYGYFPPKRVLTLVHSAGILSSLRKFVEWILAGSLGKWLEAKVKEYQLKRITRDTRTKKSGSGVCVSDDELRFHPNPKM